MAAPASPASEMLQRRAEEATGLLKMLANPDRLLLLCLICEAPRTVSSLAAVSGIPQPRLSQQLMVLREQGLVGADREGRHVRYRLESPAVAVLLGTLHQLYCPERPAPPHQDPGGSDDDDEASAPH